MSDSRSSTGRRPNGQGSYFRRRGSWYVQVTGSDGTRSKPIKFPGDWTEEQVAAKTARLAALAAEATTGRTVGPLETTAAWFGRWRAIRGDNPIEIMAGAGHDDFATTQKYIRAGEVLRRSYGEVFPELPLLSLSQEAAPSDRVAIRGSRSHAEVTS